MILITGNKVKKTHKPRYCEKEKDKANKRILRSLSFDNNINTNIIKQKQYILLLSRLMCKKNVRTKTIHGKTFINISITKVKLFWKTSGAGVLTLQCNSYHRNESVLKNIFKRGYEEIRDRKLLEIWKKDRKWLKYELHCNVKTPAPLVFQNNLTFVIEMLINVFP
jgi:hypothetical protein